MLPNSSCHPNEHKLSGINYLINWLHIQYLKKQKTWKNAIENILHNNEYNADLIRKPPPPQKQNTHTDPHHKKKKIRPIFTEQKQCYYQAGWRTHSKGCMW
jgi:hypothetical protein